MGYQEWADLGHAGPQFFDPTDVFSFSSSRVYRGHYDREHEILVLEWNDGGLPYMYHNVYPNEWANLKRVKSAGKFVNRVLNSKPFAPYTGSLAA